MLVDIRSAVFVDRREEILISLSARFQVTVLQNRTSFIPSVPGDVHESFDGETDTFNDSSRGWNLSDELRNE